MELGKVAVSGPGNFGNGPFGSDLLKSDLADSGVPVIYIRDIRTARYERVSRSFVTEAKAKSLSSCRVKPGDLLIAKVGEPPGIAAVYPADEPEGIVTQDVIRLRPNCDLVDAGFLRCWLNSPSGQQTIKTITVEATRSRFALGPLKKLSLPLPPLSEQKRIEGILDQADGLRRKRQQALALTDQFLRSTFLDLFGDPVTNPKRWNRLRIGDVAEVQGGLQVTSKRAGNPVEVPYLRVANVHRERLDLTEIKTMQVTEAERDRIALRRGDILVVEGHGNRDEIGRCAVWDGSINPCIHQNHLIRVRVNRDVALPQYISTFINSAGGRRQLFQSSNTTSGLNTISTSTVRDTVALIPPLAEQERFLSLTHQAEALCSRITAASDRSDALFHSLVQRAFRGEL